MAERKKTWRQLLAAMPPIDWAALAQERRDNCRWTKKGDKRPLEDVERKMASQRRNKLAKRKAALARAVRNYRAPAFRHRRINSVFGVAHRIALAMQPGEWHARSDIERAATLRRSTTKARLWHMRRDGLVEREPNPDYRPQALLPGEGAHEAPPERLSAPVWLWRLTEAGEVLRREAEYLS